jgi:hypothetical protein
MKPSGKEQGNIMRSGLSAMLAVLVFAGCATTGEDGRGTFKLCLVNRSDEVLQEIIIRDVNTDLKHFTDMNASSGEKVIEDCTLNLKNAFAILFYANGQRTSHVLNLSMYCPVKDRIGTLYFYYLGGNEWSVAARDAAGNEIKLDHSAAQRGDAKAQVELGVCYCSGAGVPPDYKEAVKWFRRAAEKGNAEGQYRLGVCYYSGIGVPKDQEEALKWLRKSAKQGNVSAEDFIKKTSP